MKVALLVHGYPPTEAAGAEVYAAETARGLRAQGHDVVVLAPLGARHAGGREDHAVDEREGPSGEVVFRIVQRFRELYDLGWTVQNPHLDDVVDGVLARERPDVLHVHHTVGTSTGILGRARARGIPVVVTLHDYWFLCPRGQRLRPDGGHCVEIDAARCARCIGNKTLAYAALEMRGWISGAHPDAPASRVSRVLGAPVRLAASLLSRRGAAAVEQRNRIAREALGAADRLLAPSRFLLEEYARAGYPRERLVHWPYGMDGARFDGGVDRVPSPDGRLRFAFVGSLQPSKGVDLLVRAFAGIDPSRAGLVVHGAPGGAAGAGYLEQLRKLAGTRADVRFAGRFDHDRIGEVLAAVDVLVVPSRWYENWPLTLLESVLAGVASVTADHGGMREFAETFGTAVTFAPDDVDDLRRALVEFVDDPGLAARLAAAPRQRVRTLEDDVDALVGLYRGLGAGAGGP